MLPDTVHPGARLVGRYLLEELLAEQGGTTYWRARDELLDRPVGACLLSRGPERADHLLNAARRAAAVSDPRFLRILDASERDGIVYVVTEWVTADNLADLLADGPVSPAEARTIALDVADAMTAAHRHGLAHLCLEPDKVLRAPHGQIKIVGLGVDAAVRGLTAADEAEAARRDTQGCAAILYAALTGRWPGPGTCGLPSAPAENGILRSPRQVRAGIPHDLDDIANRALAVHLREGTSAVTTPAELAELLAAGQRPHDQDRGSAPAPDVTQAIDFGDASSRLGYVAYGGDNLPPPRTGTRLAWIAVAGVLCAGLGLAGYQLVTGAFDVQRPTKSVRASPAQDSPKTTAATPLRVVDVGTLDPPPGGNGEENADRAGRVVDGKLDSEWTTKTYNDPFGPTGLKDGVGLVLDLGQIRTVSSVQVVLGEGGTDLEMRVADTRGDSAEDYRVVAQAADASGRTNLRPPEPVKARYVLLWLTSLPAVDASDYRGTISEVALHG